MACVTDPIEAATDAHAVIVCTEWDEIRSLDLTVLAGVLRYPVVVDGRNVWEPEAARAAGLQYHGIGRGQPLP